mmetsp:Transcript_22439/g.53136  ORF Transcript_22439/g.53136 Transcript_22439/m.53136 type:complete len:225 (-) Transcript_22439:325-999(-)
MDDGEDPVLVQLLHDGPVRRVRALAPLVLRVLLRGARAPGVDGDGARDAVQHRQRRARAFRPRQVPHDRLHRAGGDVGHVLERVVPDPVRPVVAVAVAVEGEEAVDTPPVRLHLRRLVAPQRLQQRRVAEHLDARELPERAPVRVLVVRVAVTHAQPPLALRGFDVAHVAEAIRAELFVVPALFLTYALFGDLKRSICAMSTCMRQIRTERAGLAHHQARVLLI